MWRSVPQIDATLTLTRTSLRPKAGIFTSRTSAPGAASGFTTANIVPAMIAHSPAKSARHTKHMILAPRSNSPVPILLLCGCGYNRGNAEEELGARQASIGFRRDGFVIFRLPAWNTERLPLARPQMLGQEYDLPNVLRVMRDLPVDRLQHRVRFAADRNRMHHIFRFQRIDGAEHDRPTFFPPPHHIRARRCQGDFKFAVA